MPHRASREEYAQRADLIGEHRLGDTGQLVLAVLFLLIWLADTFLLHLTTRLNRYGSGLVRTIVGFSLQGAAGWLAYVGMKTVFGERRDPPTVIRTGVFGVVRHPIYLAELMVYLGFLVHSTPLAAAVVWAAAAGFLHYVARHEERLLLARFGEEYARYQREVGMWWPRF